jgi:hypothetical protein
MRVVKGMPIESKPQGMDLSGAKERIQVGPVPDWVKACPYDSGYKSRQPGQVTYLLISRQTHAEKKQTCVHVAMRLETMLAVQHESQWRLEFEPATQSVLLHSIKVRRGEVEMDHTRLDKIRFLQREEGLERCVIDGFYTLLLLLEDVRPGDVLEWSYTVEHRPRLLPEFCAGIFTLPQGVPVGTYHYSVQFEDSRPMKWKSSLPELKPAETRADRRVVWEWTGQDHEAGQPEEYTPEWFMPAPWIQVSDCPDWSAIATAVARTWKEENHPALAEIVDDISSKEPELLPRVEKIIRLIQDEYRYLSVNLELGGHMPTAPEVVVRRRYGDCKDLSFLLVQLLKRLGIQARPVLVNTKLRKAVMDMLPMAGLFNHVVVEFQALGETRWVDPTIKRQGGGALNMILPDFGMGLPVDVKPAGLVAPPGSSLESGIYAVNETFLLDTTGASSLLAVVTTATGVHAERLRQEFEIEGPDEIGKKHLQACMDRFRSARRSGPFEHRDDRDANEFVMAETFEINGFLIPDASRKNFVFNVSGGIVTCVLQMPDEKPRKTPHAIPHPCNVSYSVEVRFQSVAGMAARQQKKLNDAHVDFSRTYRSQAGSWDMSLKLQTHTDAVPPEHMEDFRKLVQAIWQESSFQLVLPAGQFCPRRRSDFGALPLPSRRTGHPPRSSDAGFKPLPSIQSKPIQTETVSPHSPDAPPSAGNNGGDPMHRDEAPRTPGKRSRHRKRYNWEAIAFGAFAVIILAVIIVLLVMASHYTRRF